MSRTLFHTPPPVKDQDRSWIAQQESYGVVSDAESVVREVLEASSTSLTSNIHDDHISILDHSGQIASSIEEGNEETYTSGESVVTADAAVGEEPIGQSTAISNSDRNPDTESLSSIKSSASGDSDEQYLLPTKLDKLVEDFVRSLQEPIYEAPLTADDISNLFQDFYRKFAIQAEQYVVQQSASHYRNGKDVPMESYKEIAEKRKERTMRPKKIAKYCEAAESKACESVYEKIFRKAFSQDRKRSAELDGRIALLREIPVTLKNLDVDGIDDDELREWLTAAGDELSSMNESVTPIKKMEHLLKAHKVIVATLSERVAPKNSASADLVLPILIFTIIFHSMPNAWLNLRYVQRFRNGSSLTGELLYCITNLEAAVEFLETVTLEALNIDSKATNLASADISLLSGPSSFNQFQSFPPQEPLTDPLGAGNITPAAAPSLPRSTSMSGRQQLQHSRRLSFMPSDIADQSIKTLGSTLNSSYKYLLSKVAADKKEVADALPSTLEDARHIVGLETPQNGSPSKSLHRTISQDSISRNSNEDGPVKNRSRSSTNNSSHEPFLGRFVPSNMNVMRGLRSLSISQSESGNHSSTSLLAGAGKIAAPSEKLTQDFDQLKISDLRELHSEYKRLLKYLENINAFDS